MDNDKYPGCCDESSGRRAGNITWQDKDPSGWVGPHEAGWCLQVYNPYTGMQSGVSPIYAKINFCPYCGKSLNT